MINAKDPDYATFSGKSCRDHLIQTWPLGPEDELLGDLFRSGACFCHLSGKRRQGVEPPENRPSETAQLLPGLSQAI